MQLNAELGALSDWRLNAPAAIFIVCGPWIVTGELLKWKVICVLPLPNTNEFAAIPFTVKSLACTVDGLTAALRFITKSGRRSGNKHTTSRVTRSDAKTQRHQVDEDILLRVAADAIAPVSPGADDGVPEGAMVVVVALVVRLHRPSGWVGSGLITRPTMSSGSQVAPLSYETRPQRR